MLENISPSFGSELFRSRLGTTLAVEIERDVTEELHPRHGWPLRIRITATPKEKELDGVALDVFRPGKVCDVSSSIGAWLITNGYAMPEMRAPVTKDSRSPRVDERRRDQR